MAKTKGSLEAEISKALTHWEKDFLGRGSVSVKTDILRDMVIVTLKGVLTPAEYELSKKSVGRMSIKKIRSELVESGRDTLNQLIFELSGAEVISFHTDLSTRTGERIIIFRLNEDLEKSFSTPNI